MSGLHGEALQCGYSSACGLLPSLLGRVLSVLLGCRPQALLSGGGTLGPDSSGSACSPPSGGRLAGGRLDLSSQARFLLGLPLGLPRASPIPVLAWDSPSPFFTHPDPLLSSRRVLKLTVLKRVQMSVVSQSLGLACCWCIYVPLPHLLVECCGHFSHGRGSKAPGRSRCHCGRCWETLFRCRICHHLPVRPRARHLAFSSETALRGASSTPKRL